MHTVGFVGAGNMARALGGGIAKKAAAAALRATDPVPEASQAFEEATGGRGDPDVASLSAACDVLVLAVKPQVLEGVLADLRPHVGPGHLVVSIVAGATLGIVCVIAAEHLAFRFSDWLRERHYDLEASDLS